MLFESNVNIFLATKLKKKIMNLNALSGINFVPEIIKDNKTFAKNQHKSIQH